MFVRLALPMATCKISYSDCYRFTQFAHPLGTESIQSVAWIGFGSAICRRSRTATCRVTAQR